MASEPKPKRWWQRLAPVTREATAAAASEADARTAAARAAVAEVPFWWHSIEIVPGVVTPGLKTAEQLAHEVQMLRFPDLHGKRVLDIGGWDGFFALHAEQQGAADVTVLDHYVWSIDFQGLAAQATTADERVRYLADISTSNSPFWQPERLPGKAGFDLVRRLRGSRVRDIVADFMTVPLEEVGVWDVTLFLGVLYHLQDPLGGLRRLAAMTTEMALIESQAVSVGGNPGARLWEFYPGAELNHDPSNWFAPTAAALEGALLAAGFSRVEILVEEPEVPVGHVGGYRTAAHAYK